MSDLEKKVNASLNRLKAFQRDEGYYLAFSGGKDSVVCKALLDMANLKYDAHYRITSVDPPELIRFIRYEHPEVSREVPVYKNGRRGENWNGKPITMWNLIPWKLTPPTRVIRYCCQFLKEDGGDGRMTVTGVRWAESRNRKENQGPVTIYDKQARREFGDNPDFTLTNKGGVVLVNDNTDSRRMVENCYKRHKTTVNPIIEWSDKDVWDFIHAHGIHYCSLYDEGFSRLGCIGCPLARKHGREMEFNRWPKFKGSYIRAFAAMLKERERRGKTGGFGGLTSAMDVFNWWMEYNIMPGQIPLEAVFEDDFPDD